MFLLSYLSLNKRWGLFSNFFATLGKGANGGLIKPYVLVFLFESFIIGYYLPKKYFFIENLKTLRNGFSLGTYVDLKKMQNCTRPSHNFKVSVDQSCWHMDY